jgi:hypothetical protein
VACLSALLITFTVLAGFVISTGMYLRENAALREQQRLRQVAETARAAEARLRQQAQARANVSLASLLLSQGKTDEADAVLRQTPLDTIEPSQEATGVFRALGDWHLLHNRWKAAAECYLLLPLANRFIPNDQISGTGDMIRTAPALVMAGMDDAYEAHRALLIDRFTGTSNSNAAEQLVKMCLLRPASPELIQRLQASAEFLRKQSAVESPWMSMLVNTALALYELRGGNPAEAIVRADIALPLAERAPRSAGSGDYQAFLHSILLMACRQTGDTTRAAAEKDAMMDYLNAHGEEFIKLSPSENTNFVPVVERALAMILSREALAVE